VFALSGLWGKNDVSMVKGGDGIKNFEKRWFRRSLSDKTGQTLTLHRYGTNKQCGT